MSDPVSNAEIEDVLSSIRRLVSEDHRVTPQPEARKEPAEEKLVLTPSFRVPEPEGQPDEAAQSAVARAAGPEVDEAPSGDTLSTPYALDSFEITALEEPEEQETAAPWADPQATLYDAADIDPEEIETPSSDATAEVVGIAGPSDDVAAGADSDPEPVADLNAGRDELTESVEEMVSEFSEDNEVRDVWTDEPAEDEPVHVGPPSAAEPNDAEAMAEPEQVAGLAAASDDDARSDAELISEVEPLQLVPELAADPQPEAGFVFGSKRGAGTEPLGAKIEALETVVGDTDEQWEPDGVGADDYSGTSVETLTWEDHTEDDSETEEYLDDHVDPALEPATDDLDPMPEEPVPGQGLGADVLASDEAIMDEDALRELVSDIVREELQGALGERITRNVRKLVRREIHRAMTAQDFD